MPNTADPLICIHPAADASVQHSGCRPVCRGPRMDTGEDTPSGPPFSSAREEQEWVQQEKSRLMDDMRRGHLAEHRARESAPAPETAAGFLPRLAASPVPGGWEKEPDDHWGF